MQWRRHFGAVGIMARISWVSASCVDSRFRATGKTQVKPQQQFRGRSEMIPKSSIMFRFLLFQAQPACRNLPSSSTLPAIPPVVSGFREICARGPSSFSWDLRAGLDAHTQGEQKGIGLQKRSSAKSKWQSSYCEQAV